MGSGLFPGGSHSWGRGSGNTTGARERDLGGAGRERGGRDGQPAGQPFSAHPRSTVPRSHSPPLCLPSSLPPSIAPENGILKTGCIWTLFRKEHPIHHSWASSQEAFSKHSGFRKSVFRPQLVTFFLIYACCFNFLHKLFYFRIVLDLPDLQR